jgi:PIN domain nuclease of toxin-antitoxin system
MRVLLDTQAWLWMRMAPGRLSTSARKLVANRRNQLVLSAASPWEIAIKASAGKLRLPCSVEEFVLTRSAATEITPLPITQLHAIESASLPAHHKDPFDRVLIAQARLEKIPLLTADRALAAYDVEILLAD